MKEMGDIMGIFVGHDHINDYIGKYEDIYLGYGRGTGYSTYSRTVSSRRALSNCWKGKGNSAPGYA